VTAGVVTAGAAGVVTAGAAGVVTAGAAGVVIAGAAGVVFAGVVTAGAAGVVTAGAAGVVVAVLQADNKSAASTTREIANAIKFLLLTNPLIVPPLWLFIYSE